MRMDKVYEEHIVGIAKFLKNPDLRVRIQAAKALGALADFALTVAGQAGAELATSGDARELAALRHLDGEMLAFVGRDPGDLDQITLVRRAGRRGGQLNGVVDDAG